MIGSLPLMWETQSEFLALGFGLPQLKLLKASAEWNFLSLSLSLSLSLLIR